MKGVLPTSNWIDDVLSDSFPASDPPSWTLGIARTDPAAMPAGRAAPLGFLVMLQPRDLVPHFAVSNFRGERVQYSSIWQRKHLVLVTLPDLEAASRNYADRLMARVRGLNEDDTEWIVTGDRVAGIPCPGVVVADRWGEVVHVAHPSEIADLPMPDELFEWVHYMQHQCPECEGEAK